MQVLDLHPGDDRSNWKGDIPKLQPLGLMPPDEGVTAADPCEDGGPIGLKLTS